MPGSQRVRLVDGPSVFVATGTPWTLGPFWDGGYLLLDLRRTQAQNYRVRLNPTGWEGPRY